jgi:hypothetical protein
VEEEVQTVRDPTQIERHGDELQSADDGAPHGVLLLLLRRLQFLSADSNERARSPPHMGIT